MTQIADLRQHEIREAPFAHVVREQFIDPAEYARLRDSFPECPPSSGPTGFSLFWGDEQYEQLLAEKPEWRSLFETFHNQAFIDWGVRQFSAEWQRAGCRIDLSSARYVSYREDRIDKERATLRRVAHGPDELWVRMDIHQGRVGYSRDMHRDHARRLISMLVYFCSQDANAMSGGELLLHASGWSRFRRPVTIVPLENLMVAFPCSSRSFHSVPRIASMKRPRNYLQVHISSSVDVWPR